MKFCQVCNNLLYPRENKRDRRLEFVCKSAPCTYVDNNEDEDTLVYRNDVSVDTATNLRAILSDVNKDPTLQRSTNMPCPECGHDESVIFLAEQNAKSTKLQLIHVCTNFDCNHKWFA
jgi:DNA-directed RNA polymerase II subunit RPB9